MATLQGKAVKNTYRQVLQIGANNVGVSGTLQPVQDGAGVNTALSLSTLAATVNGDLTVTGDLIITGGGLQIKELIDDTVAALIKNGTGITWTYNDAANTLTGNFTGTTTVVPEGSNLYYTQGRFDSAFAAKSTTNLAEGTNLYFTEARGNANFATNLAASDTNDLAEGSTNLYYTNARARTALSVTAGTGLSYDNTTGVFNLAAIPNASLTNSSITINGQAVSLGGSVTLTTTNIAEGTNLYWTEARGNSNFATNLAASTTTNLAEGTNLYYTQARFDTAFSNKSTTNLAEGTNLYYTQARFNSALAAKTTTDLAEGTNLYYTDARARLALASSATGLTYANNSGVFSLTAGYAIPTTVKLGEYDIAYNRSIVSAAVTGTSTKTLSLTQQDANVITATWTDQGITTINGTANQIAATTVGNTTTLAFTNDVTMPNNLVVSGNLTINGTATYVNTESISSKDPLFEVANTNNTTDAVDIGYYGRYYDAVQERVEFTGLFRDASDAGKFKIFSGLVDEPTNVVNTTGTGYTVATLVANVDGNLAGTANAANILSTARTIAASGDAAWSVSFDGSANVTSALTLANTGVTATTYGTSTAVPTIAVDSKGRITSASNTNITFPVTTVNGFAGTVVLTTSDVAEGTNQYFTTARAQASITGGASSVVTANLTASRALVSDGSGKIAASATTTTTEIGYLAGVTSAIQTQLNSKLNLTGGTLTGPLIGTTGSFSSSGSGDTFTIGHTSGSGVALTITKGGNGEALVINKTSGSGNALSVTGTTSLGALTGTSSTFSGNITSNSNTGGLILNRTATTDYSGVTLQTNSVARWFTGMRETGTGNDYIIYNTPNNLNALRLNETTGAATFSSTITSGSISANAGNRTLTFDNLTNYGQSLVINSSGSLPLILQTNGTNALTINSAQAATFSSSVSTTELKLNNISALIHLTSYNVLRDTDANNAIILGNSSTPQNFYNNTEHIFRNRAGNATYLSIISGGNVGIGTSSPDMKLQIGDGTGTGNQFLRMFSSACNMYIGQHNSLFSLGTIQTIVTDSTYTNPFVIGTLNGSAPLVFGTNGSERMRITSDGLVGIGNSAGVGKLQVWSTTSTSGSYPLTIYNPSGVDLLYIRGDGYAYIAASAWAYGSDKRIKENIDYIETGLDKILALKPAKFDYIDGLKDNIGWIAQDVQEVIPEAVNTISETNDQLTLKSDFIVPYLVKAVQELEARIKELEAK
jgi:hypothetical protein